MPILLKWQLLHTWFLETLRETSWIIDYSSHFQSYFHFDLIYRHLLYYLNDNLGLNGGVINFPTHSQLTISKVILQIKICHLESFSCIENAIFMS